MVGRRASGPLLLDDLRHDLGRDRLDIGGVGELGIGHDRRRVRVDQHDPVALGAQRLAGLRPGIVELAGLADDDRPAPMMRMDEMSVRLGMVRPCSALARANAAVETGAECWLIVAVIHGRVGL
jgi:hypothetical protein